MYDKQRLTGWRVSQQLRLRSENAGALSELIGQLQERLAARSIEYQLSPEKRSAAERQLELQDEALRQAKHRLDELAAQQLVGEGIAKDRSKAIKTLERACSRLADLVPPVDDASIASTQLNSPKDP